MLGTAWTIWERSVFLKTESIHSQISVLQRRQTGLPLGPLKQPYICIMSFYFSSKIVCVQTEIPPTPMLLSFLAKWLFDVYNPSRSLLEHAALIQQNYGNLLLFERLMCKVYLPPSYLIGNGPVGNKDTPPTPHTQNSFKYSNAIGGIIKKLLVSYLLSGLSLCTEQISFKGAAEMLLHRAVTSDALIHAT